MDYLLLDVVDVVPAREANGPGLSFYLLLGITILAEAALMSPGAFVLRKGVPEAGAAEQLTGGGSRSPR